MVKMASRRSRTVWNCRHVSEFISKVRHKAIIGTPLLLFLLMSTQCKAWVPLKSDGYWMDISSKTVKGGNQGLHIIRMCMIDLERPSHEEHNKVYSGKHPPRKSCSRCPSDNYYSVFWSPMRSIPHSDRKWKTKRKLKMVRKTQLSHSLNRH